MRNTQDLKNYDLNQITTHKSPIVRNKSLNRLSENPIINRNGNIKNLNERKNNITEYHNLVPRRNNNKNINNIKNYDLQKPNFHKSSSEINYFYHKNNFDKIPSKRNGNKLNGLYKKRRNASMKNKEEGKTEKYFYTLICTNSYNHKKATKNFKNIPLEKKDLLNKTFNRINPFYFQDKMRDFHKDNINNKINDLEKLQRDALNKLAKYQIENPTNKEKLQKANEYSINPLNSQEKQDERLIKTQRNYDNKENFIIKNKDLYKIDQPRKAIKDYFNKCIYQVPVLEEEYHIDPQYKKEYNKELKKQIEENRNNKKKKKDEEIKEEKMANKEMNDYIEFLNKKNKENKQKKYEEFYKRNKILDDLKKRKEEEEKKNDQKFDQEFRKKIKEEDEKMKENKKQKKLNDIDKYQKFLNDFEKQKRDKKKEIELENNKWKNYSQEYNAKCKHGLDIYRCAICNKVFPKDKLIKYYYLSSTDISGASSKRSSFI